MKNARGEGMKVYSRPERKPRNPEARRWEGDRGPIHRGEEIGRGLLSKIIKDAGLTKEEFLKLLQEHDCQEATRPSNDIRSVLD
jgi:hypothetical protein